MGYATLLREPDRIWLTTAAGQVEPLIAHMSRYRIREDVQFADRTGESSKS